MCVLYSEKQSMMSIRTSLDVVCRSLVFFCITSVWFVGGFGRSIALMYFLLFQLSTFLRYIAAVGLDLSGLARAFFRLGNRVADYQQLTGRPPHEPASQLLIEVAWRSSSHCGWQAAARGRAANGFQSCYSGVNNWYNLKSAQTIKQNQSFGSSFLQYGMWLEHLCNWKCTKIYFKQRKPLN